MPVPSTSRPIVSIVTAKNVLEFWSQYVTARYLSAGSGLEQLTWILEGKLFTDSFEELEDLVMISFEELLIPEISSPEILNLYEDYLEVIESFYGFPHYFNGLVANLLLFQTTEKMKQELEDPDMIESLLRDAKIFAERELGLSMSQQKFELSCLTFALTKLRVIFNYLKLGGDGDLIPAPTKIPKNVSVNFTETEEKWLCQKFNEMQTQFSSVVPTEFMINHALQVLQNCFALVTDCTIL